MIELNQLKQLVMIAGCGTLSKASEQLYLSQPSLTRSIQQLEDALEVKLFDRKKNKMTLNETGVVTVEYARKILAQTDDMIAYVRTFDNSRKTFTVGSCAPAPLWKLEPLISKLYAGMTVSSEMKGTGDLLQGVRDRLYRIVIIPERIDDTDLFCMRYGEEKLFISLPPAHPLAKYKKVSFSDLDGEVVLLFTQIGFWFDMTKLKMPHARFLLQNERFAFEEIVKSSALPHFVTDISLSSRDSDKNRVVIPITDPEAAVTYYAVCRNDIKDELSRLLQQIQEQ
jgi:DNA-binding transcriptional LysR family regulator